MEKHPAYLWPASTECYSAVEVDARIDELRELMRELWRAEGNVSDALAARCKGFMGGG